MTIFKKLLAVVAAVNLVLGVTACAPAKVDMTKVTAVIDVRTAAEFAEGHLEGALNIDVTAGDFQSEISALDPAGKYVLYCRSGNRAGQAIQIMQGLGFTDLTNAGGVQSAADATGLAIVQ